MKVKSQSEVAQSCPTLATPWTAAYQAPPSMDFLGKSTGMGCHCLLLIPSRVFLISVIVLLVSVCLFFNSSRSLLIYSCILSVFKIVIMFTINILNSLSGSLPISSSFIWTSVFLVHSFICVVFICLFFSFLFFFTYYALGLPLPGYKFEFFLPFSSFLRLV